MSDRSSMPVSGETLTLSDLRAMANKFFASISIVLFLVTTGVAWIGDQNILVASGISLLAFLATAAAIKLYGEALPAIVVVSASLAVQEMMLIFAASNMDPARVQEAHMVYFVLNAFLLLYASWKGIIIYNILIVLHHFILTFFLPAAVWTEAGAPAGLWHLLVHASIAAVLGIPLIFIAEALRRMITGNQEALGAAAQATATAMAKTAEAERNRNQTIEERSRAEKIQVEGARALAEVVQQLGDGLARLSSGDLTYRLTQTFARDYKKLQDDFNAAVAKLEETMAVISGATGNISAGAGELTRVSTDLARRSEQQAASLEETAAALDEITATVKKTAEGAIHAREVVTAAKSDAERSSEVVSKAVAAMGRIENSAKEIGNIIGVIDEIAFQTNLLALNAGVEAARAGDAGRGFAVVASEVRALAQRSAEAAKQIKTLISTSGTQVATGVNLVDETGAALRRIASRIAEINDVVVDIAASAQQQASGLLQVNSSVTQMDQITQQNTAMVEESTAASRGLADDAEGLARLTGQFRLNDRPMGRTDVAKKVSAPGRNPVHAARDKIAAFAAG